MKKKRRKPTRWEVRVIIQYWLLQSTMAIGFSTVYLILLRFAGFQNGMWAEVISVICGCLSTFGMDRWITRSGKEE